MEKSGFSAYAADDEREEITVSGTERYNRVSWSRYVSSAAALIIAVVGIAGVVMIHGNLNGNDDFEIDTPPSVSSYDTEAESVSEETTKTTKNKGYIAGGHDYANDTDYSGIIVGGTPQTPPTVDESSSEDTAENEDTPVVNNNSNNNTPVQPATQAPVTPPVTEALTAPPVTEPVTDAVQSEAQKSYLNDLYYVEIEGVSGYMAFDFMQDGTLTKYAFDDYGNVINSTIITTSYEIIENQFSFGDTDKKSGIIMNPNDTGNFSVKFEDGLYNFSQETPVFATSGITLSGLWFGNSAYGLRKLEFHSDTSGSFIYTNDIVNVEFEYKIENNHVYFIVYGDTLEGDIIRDYDGQRFTVLWNDGTTEYFYDEKTWWEMNE